MRFVLVMAQAATYIALGALLITRGQWKLGVAQLLLAAVQALVFS